MLRVVPSALPRHALAAVLAICAHAHAAGADREPRGILRVSYEDTHNFPYHLGVGEEVPALDAGLSVDLLRLAGDRLGLELSFERLPWRRCLRRLGEDRVDAVFNASFREDRLAIARYPMRGGAPDRERRIMTTHYGFYRMRDSPLRWDGERLTRSVAGQPVPFDGPVGSVNGYSVSALLRERGYVVDDAGTRSSRYSLRKLLKGRVPVVVDAEPRMRWFTALEPERYADVVELEPPVFERDYYLVVSHGFADAHPELAEALWNAIAQLRVSEEAARLRSRYDALLEEMSATSAALVP